MPFQHDSLSNSSSSQVMQPDSSCAVHSSPLVKRVMNYSAQYWLSYDPSHSSMGHSSTAKQPVVLILHAMEQQTECRQISRQGREG
jgi:hypothetical protein